MAKSSKSTGTSKSANKQNEKSSINKSATNPAKAKDEKLRPTSKEPAKQEVKQPVDESVQGNASEQAQKGEAISTEMGSKLQGRGNEGDSEGGSEEEEKED